MALPYCAHCSAREFAPCSEFTSGVFTDVFYVVDQNVAISLACVNHIPYSRYLTKNPFKIHIDFETRGTGSAKMLTDCRCYTKFCDPSKYVTPGGAVAHFLQHAQA